MKRQGLTMALPFLLTLTYKKMTTQVDPGGHHLVCQSYLCSYIE